MAGCLLIELNYVKCKAFVRAANDTNSWRNCFDVGCLLLQEKDIYNLNDLLESNIISN